MKKFEYKSVNIKIDTTLLGKVKKFDEIDVELNKLGREGWEIINFSTGDSWSNNSNSVFVILKRAFE